MTTEPRNQGFKLADPSTAEAEQSVLDSQRFWFAAS